MFMLSKYALRQVMTIFPVIITQFVFGMGWGWTAPTLSKVHAGETEFTLTDDEESWMASINELGRCGGPLLAALFVDTAGRKITLIMVSVALCVSWIGLIFANDVAVIYTLRMIFGIGNGIGGVTSSIYLAENLSPTLRGIMSGIVVMFHYGGISFQYSLGAYLSYRVLAIVNASISITALFSQYLTTETPYFLTMKGKYEKAEKNYAWLHGPADEDVTETELDKIKQNANDEKLKKASITSLLSNAENVNSIFIVVGVYLLTSAAGNGPLIVYSTLIFDSTDVFSADDFNVLYGFIQFLVVCISPFIVERFNRRRLIIISFVARSLCDACTALIFFLHGTAYQIPHHPWLVFIFVSANTSFMALTHPVLYVIRGEIFPMSIKAFGGTAAIMIQSFVSFGTSKMFVFIVNVFGMEVNFLFYFIMCVLSVIYTFLFLPETRGKSLVEIQKTLQ